MQNEREIQMDKIDDFVDVLKECFPEALDLSNVVSLKKLARKRDLSAICELKKKIVVMYIIDGVNYIDYIVDILSEVDFKTLVRSRNVPSREYKILHGIRQWLISKLSERRNARSQKLLKKLKKEREVTFLTGRWSILIKFIKRHKIDIFSHSGLRYLRKHLDYKRLNFFDLKDLSILGEKHAKKLLEKEIIESILENPTLNAGSLFRKGYFDYLNKRGAKKVLKKAPEEVKLKSLRPFATLVGFKARKLLKQKSK